MSSPEPLPPTDALQQPLPPTAVRHFPDAFPAAPNVVLPLNSPDAFPATPNVALPLNSPVWTKLSLLRHAYQFARSAARKVLLLRVLLLAAALLAAIPLGILSGIGVYNLKYDSPHRHAQAYTTGGEWNNGMWRYHETYYIDGKEATRQEYDYFLRHDNETSALALAIPAGILVGAVTVIVFWLLLRPRRSVLTQTIDEQIAAIAREHPEAVASWGGVAVLRVPQLVEQLLDMQSKDIHR